MLRRLLPRRCAVCDLAAADPVCAGCERDFFDASVPRCLQCALPVPAGVERCGRCLSSPPPFDRTIALGDYAPPIDGMIGALKFSARLDLAHCFGRLLAARAESREPGWVVAMPLSTQRLAERGYNQSLLIARAFARHARAELAPLNALQRSGHRPPQQSLPLDARRRNVRDAFAADAVVAGRSVWIVDDVLTTGSTLAEAARVMKAAGATTVIAWVVARTR